MGGAGVHFTLTADEAQAVNGLLKITRANKKNEESFKRVKKASKETSSAIGKTGKNISGTVTGMLSLGTAAAGVGKFISLWSADVQKTMKLVKELTADLGSIASSSGDLKNIAQVKQNLVNDENLSGLHLKDRVKLYGAVRGSLPNAELSTVMKIVSGAGRAIGTGSTPEQVVQLGGVAGDLHKAFKDTMSPSEIVDLAKSATEQFGKRGKKFERSGVDTLLRGTQNGFGSPKKLLSMMIASLDAGGGPSNLSMTMDQIANLKPVTAKNIKDPEAQAKILTLNSSLRDIDRRQEKLRRDAFDDKSLSSPQRKRRAEAREQELESLRRKEIDARDRIRELKGKTVLQKFSPESIARNNVTSLPNDQRLDAIVKDRKLAQLLVPGSASQLAAMNSRDVGKVRASLDGSRGLIERERDQFLDAGGVPGENFRLQVAADRISVMKEKAIESSGEGRRQIRFQMAENFVEAKIRSSGAGPKAVVAQLAIAKKEFLKANLLGTSAGDAIINAGGNRGQDFAREFDDIILNSSSRKVDFNVTKTQPVKVQVEGQTILGAGNRNAGDEATGRRTQK